MCGAGETKMNRPKYVGDAIELDANDQYIGHYGSYVLKPAYQPIYEVIDNKIAVLKGYEALIRPQLNGLGINPEEFFGFVDKNDALFIECLCLALHIRGYKKAGIQGAGLFVNVNVANYETVEDVEREFFYTFSQLAKHGLGRQTIVFEILETEVANPEILLTLCKLIKNNGYTFALDDFGTRHSNVERYIAVSPDIIKLDRSLFLNAMKKPETSKLLKSLISAFQENGVKVLMEGLETVSEMQFASDMQVDMLQGFYLGRPASLVDVFSPEIILPKQEEAKSLVLAN